MKKEQLRQELLKRGGNGRTLMELQDEVGLEYFKVPFEDVEYVGTVVVKVEEGLLEIPYRMDNLEGSYEAFVVGAEELIDEERVRKIQSIFASQQAQFTDFCQSTSKKTTDYLALAEELFFQYQSNRVHHQDVWRVLETEPKCKGLAEDIVEAIEVYLRYNLSDFSLKDKDIDVAKEILKKESVQN